MPDPIIDAAARVVGRHGLARFHMGDVARAAGVARQTVHRHYPTKHDLVEALIAAEEDALLAAVIEALVTPPDPIEGLAAAIEQALTGVRRHPLLSTLLQHEHDQVLPYLTSGASALVERARTSLAPHLATRLSLAAERATDLADALVRLVLSHALTPSGRPDHAVAAALTSTIAPMREERPTR